jgi:hypothetical protein
VPSIGEILPVLEENKKRITVIQKARNINCSMEIYKGIKKAEKQSRTKSAAALIIPIAK